MPNPVVVYVVVGLRKQEISDVIDVLQKRSHMKLAEWVEAQRNAGMYGDDPEEWKPFLEETIADLLQGGDASYHSATSLIHNLKEQGPDTTSLLDEHVDVYFIDLLATLLPCYRSLALAIDMHLAKGDDGYCCFLGVPGLESELFKLAHEEYCCAWKTLANFYKRGAPHRLAIHKDDLLNVREYISKQV
ncbi:unnamed protein product, partial [marine sediment metagenome]